MYRNGRGQQISKQEYENRYELLPERVKSEMWLKSIHSTSYSDDQPYIPPLPMTEEEEREHVALLIEQHKKTCEYLKIQKELAKETRLANRKRFAEKYSQLFKHMNMEKFINTDIEPEKEKEWYGSGR